MYGLDHTVVPLPDTSTRDFYQPTTPKLDQQETVPTPDQQETKATPDQQETKPTPDQQDVTIAPDQQYDRRFMYFLGQDPRSF
jgi:hypothetical protein